MYEVINYMDNPNISVTSRLGIFTALEYREDTSLQPVNAELGSHCRALGLHKRQLTAQLHPDGPGAVIQPGAMHWTAGSVQAQSGARGMGALLGSAVRGQVTGDSAVKPEYSGTGLLVLEPGFRHLLLLDAGAWEGGLVCDDSAFLACESSLDRRSTSRSALGVSAVGGSEGMWTLTLLGAGAVCLSSDSPREALVEVRLQEDELRVDGGLAVAWSGTLEYGVERSTKTLLGSAATGEGFLNVYRGSGRVLLSPLRRQNALR